MSSLTGSIYLNGKPRDEEGFRKISAYVMQVRPLIPYTPAASIVTDCHASGR